MKRFGFHPDQLYFNMRNPRKVRYLSHPKLGDFEAPKKGKPGEGQNVNHLFGQY